MSLRLPALLVLALALLLSGCSGGGAAGGTGGTSGDALRDLSLALAREEADYLARRVTLRGRLVDAAGAPLAAAELLVGGQRVAVPADGRFSVTGLAPRSVALRVEAAGYRSLHTVAPLQLAPAVEALDLGELVLEPERPDVVRFFFAGDLSFGRRFMDPDDLTPRGQIPPDNPAALVRSGAPREGALSVLQFVRPLVESADFAVANFETPALDDPSTPHQTKDFAFFSLTETIGALSDSGLDYVSLGNNHVYDYLDSGLDQTLRALRSTKLGFSGAGLTPGEAMAPFDLSVKGHSYALFSATSVAGRDESPNFVAESGKGGAADLDAASAVAATLAAVSPERHIIGQLHGGAEYSLAPGPVTRQRMKRVAAAGARLIVMHHPHTAQGFGLVEGVPAALGLGNFAFDQNRLETMFGLALLADMRGGEVLSMRGVPLYLKDYRPRLVGGEAADQLIRRIAEFSDLGVQVYPYQQQAWVNYGSPRPVLARNIVAQVEIGADGLGYLDLRGLRREGESLRSARFEAAAGAAQLGRDLMLYGDFEDWDADDGGRDAARWDLSGSSLALCVRAARRGSAGVCSARSAGQSIDSVVPFRNTIRIQFGGREANKDVTVLGYLKGAGAGAAVLRLRYLSDADELLFGEQDVPLAAGGSYDWQLFAVPTQFPDDSVTQLPPPDRLGNPQAAVPARGLRVFLRHLSPGVGTGLLMADDFAVVAWEAMVASGLPIAVPHARDFLRFRGTPGRHAVSIEFARFTPY